jgi:hypothetical protein
MLENLAIILLDRDEVVIPLPSSIKGGEKQTKKENFQKKTPSFP